MNGIPIEDWQPAADDARVEDVAASAAPTSPDDFRWQMSYDRVSVERFMRDVEHKRTELLAGIDAARSRIERAEAAMPAAPALGDADLSALVLAAQQELAEIEREHRRIVDAIGAAAADEAARILGPARAEAALVRSAATSLATAASPPRGERVDDR